MLHLNRRTRFTFLNLITYCAASAVVSLTLALAAGAQAPAPAFNDYNLKNTACNAGLPCGNVTPSQIVVTLVNTVMSVVGILAVVMIVYGGVLWLTSAGNEEKIKKARSLLVNAVIGLVIILSAFAISTFVLRALQRATVPTGEVTGPPAVTNCESPNYCTSSIGCSNQLSSYTCIDPNQVCCAP